MLRILALVTLVALSAAAPAPAHATRVAELCDVEGVRANQLIGYGLVVGLAGTGDSGQARFTVQSTAAMLRRLGATIDPKSIQTKNAAAVIVTATLPPSARPGTRIDVVVSSLGNAKSLEGGTLLQTPLVGADRNVYAVSQGPLLVGGFSAGSQGNSASSNHVTVARIPMGAIVERPAPRAELSNQSILLQLREHSFMTASRIAKTINTDLGSEVARAVDGAAVELNVASLAGAVSPVELLARVQALDVAVQAPVRVIIDERTGTVVLGGGIRIGEVAIAQGGLSVQIKRTPRVSQPGALAGGDTAVVQDVDVQAEAIDGDLHLVPATASLGEVVQALNALGASPRNLIAIFQALRSAGALRADIEVQ